jgi:catechol 2,3-dioxygenase-like lactoylglutathione lyase family enzyme
MTIRGSDFAVYQVSNLARSATFYRDNLGLPQKIYSEEYQWAGFNCCNVMLSLHGGIKLPEVIAGGRIALAVANVPAPCAESKSKGVRVIGEPADYPSLLRRGGSRSRRERCGSSQTGEWNLWVERGEPRGENIMKSELKPKILNTRPHWDCAFAWLQWTAKKHGLHFEILSLCRTIKIAFGGGGRLFTLPPWDITASRRVAPHPNRRAPGRRDWRWLNLN